MVSSRVNPPHSPNPPKSSHPNTTFSPHGIIQSVSPFIPKCTLLTYDMLPKKHIGAVSRKNFIPVHRYGRPKKCPQKQKVKLLGLTCLFVKRKFNETQYFGISVLTTPTTENAERQFLALTFLSTKL